MSKSKDLYLNFLLSSPYTSWGVIIDDKQNQPGNFKFPKRSFGQQNPEQRAFNPRWFIQRPWLHYDEVFIIQTVFTKQNVPAMAQNASTGVINFKIFSGRSPNERGAPSLVLSPLTLAPSALVKHASRISKSFRRPCISWLYYMHSKEISRSDNNLWSKKLYFL